MFVKNKLIIIILFIIIALQYSAAYARDSFYSKDELTLLEKTLSALEYDHGYDYRIEAPYIYSYSYSKENFDKKEKALAEIINNADYKLVLDLYKKIQRVQAIIDYKLNRYKTDQKWKYHTFIKNDLLEPVNNYSALLLKYILKKNSSLANFLEMQKESISAEVVKTYNDKDEIIDTF
jgi:hypothetical protein